MRVAPYFHSHPRKTPARAGVRMDASGTDTAPGSDDLTPPTASLSTTAAPSLHTVACALAAPLHTAASATRRVAIGQVTVYRVRTVPVADEIAEGRVVTQGVDAGVVDVVGHVRPTCPERAVVVGKRHLLSKGERAG